MKKYNVGCEVSLVAYNGRSTRSACKESLITGLVVKVTNTYIHIRSYEDGLIWKAPRWI
jgi:hypothetical protein